MPLQASSRSASRSTTCGARQPGGARQKGGANLDWSPAMCLCRAGQGRQTRPGWPRDSSTQHPAAQGADAPALSSQRQQHPAPACSSSSRLNLDIRVSLMLRSAATCSPSRCGRIVASACGLPAPAPAPASSCTEPPVVRRELPLLPAPPTLLGRADDGCGGELLLTASCTAAKVSEALDVQCGSTPLEAPQVPARKRARANQRTARRHTHHGPPPTAAVERQRRHPLLRGCSRSIRRPACCLRWLSLACLAALASAHKLQLAGEAASSPKEAAGVGSAM